MAHADIEPGSWELSASTEVQGIREPTSMVQTRCLTPEGELALKAEHFAARSRITGRRIGGC